MDDIDTTNYAIVGVMGDRITVMNPPRGPITKGQALVIAAWLLVLADDGDGQWERTLEAVKNS